MIKFLCDLCGKDISEKVQDSIRQFCGRDYDGPSAIARVTEDRGGQLPDTQHDVDEEKKPVYLDVQLLNELSRLIHASAWGMLATSMQCGNCAMERAGRRTRKVATIFTRIAEEGYPL